jgi:GT2 family glycosyltransferase
VAGVSVVIATRDRRDELCRTLDRLTGLRGRPPVIVVDNGSRDGTADTVRRLYPDVDLITLRGNRGAAGRNTGVRRAATRYVAFSDDDSWWDPGALERACALLDAYPEVGAVTGRTLVGPDWREDPLNEVLARSPLPRAGLPGPRVLGFLGCALVARRSAFLSAGGYRPLLGIGGEEELLALDLASAGWACVYAPDMVARHVPSEHRDVPGRQAAMRRNKILIAVLRRPAGRALRLTAGLMMDAFRDPVARRALEGLLPRLPLALLERRPVPRAVAALEPR